MKRPIGDFIFDNIFVFAPLTCVVIAVFLFLIIRKPEPNPDYDKLWDLENEIRREEVRLEIKKDEILLKKLKEQE